MELDALIRALAPSEVTGGRPVDDRRSRVRHADVSREGALFFCVPGERVDGHDLAWEAIERGAAALVVERPLDVDVPQLVVPSDARVDGGRGGRRSSASRRRSSSSRA